MNCRWSVALRHERKELKRACFKSISGGGDCPDRGCLMVNMFFNRGRLYLIQGINLPSTEGASSSPAALRFASSRL